MSREFSTQLSTFFEEQHISSTPGRNEPTKLAEWLEGRNLSSQERSFTLSQAHKFYERGFEFPFSSEFTAFLRQLIEHHSPATVFDPSAYNGKTLEALSPLFPGASFLGLCHITKWVPLLRILYPHAELHEGSYEMFPASNEALYDAVVTFPPMSAKSREERIYRKPDGSKVSITTREKAEDIILAAGCRLSETGKIYTIVSPNVLSSRTQFLESLALLGLYVEAAFELPARSFGIQSSTAGTLLVISNTAHGEIFRARLTDSSEWNAKVAENFIVRKNDPEAIERGILAPYQSEKNLNWLLHEKLCSEKAAEAKGEAIPLGDLASGIITGRQDPDFEFPEHPNAVYLSRIGNRDVEELPEQLGLKYQHIVQVQIPAEKVKAQFVRHALNSDFGRQQLDFLKAGTTIPFLNSAAIRSLRIILPPLSVQKEILEYEGHLASHEASLLGLQNDLEDARRHLWSQTEVDDTALASLARLEEQLSKKDSDEPSQGLENWIETLPFPLASILRTWQACDPAEHEARYKHLLHFFEAAAQFMSVILLSGFQRDPHFYEEHREGLLKRIGGAGSSLERPCFGTWKTIRASMGKVVGKLTNFNGKKPEIVEENEQQSLKLFADSSHQLPQTVANTKFAEIFDKTCNYRNEWTAHTGLVDSSLAQTREQELCLYLEKFRSLCGGLWEHTLLVKPESSQNKRGRHHHKLKILRGSNTTFFTEDRIFNESLDTEALYLVSGSSNEALMLLPLIRMDSSPASAKNACYFYLRSTAQGEVTFVSYHHRQEAEFKGQYDEVGEAIRSLTEGLANP